MGSGSKIERQITGTSNVSVDDAIERGLTAAHIKFGQPDWFKVGNVRGFIHEGRVTHYEVTLELGFAGAEKLHESGDYFRSACGGKPMTKIRPSMDVRY
ncbi:dodecin family protein [Hyphomonas pacifica]|uniref:Dodecin flavoprotein n=1 Tax=Hyphomonas pacifica TaxID=1280941 RepID=A0A062U0B6_9PROT|nr:dodecin family protein [Hyphomonas pacifica]KCZ51712.1 hypothetical protein HY2_01800 [Hyphomonas pacifica]RAN32394.1 hypothetical protein HY11_04810 [Hyphomonas pacifica]RAN34381.1 hypothetical protein HY3_01885 [Hyphomonas pacifica]